MPDLNRLYSKLIQRKFTVAPKTPRGRYLSRLCLPFLGPVGAILNFAGGAALQVVNECPRRRQAGIVFTNYVFGVEKNVGLNKFSNKRFGPKKHFVWK